MTLVNLLKKQGGEKTVRERDRERKKKNHVESDYVDISTSIEVFAVMLVFSHGWSAEMPFQMVLERFKYQQTHKQTHHTMILSMG